jgi:hypothetical protein
MAALAVAEYYLSFSPRPMSGYWLGLLLATLFWQTNPIIASISITDPSAFSRMSTMSATLGVKGTWLDVPVWTVCLGFEIVCSGLLLWWATRALRRPFTEPQWVEGKARRILWWRPASDRGARTAARRELPLVSRLGFANPVLQREVRSKFRLRRQSPWTMFVEAMAGAFVLYWYARGLWWTVDKPEWREGIWVAITMIGLISVNVAAALMGAAAFSHEREAGTWEGLQLSLLSPRAIIFGKLLPPVLSCAVYSLPLWPLLLSCINKVVFVPPKNYTSSGISLTQAVATILIVFATAWCCTAWGMWFSWRCRRTAAALGWTIGTALFALIFLPTLLSIHWSGPPGEFPGLMRYWHPYVAVGLLFDRPYAVSRTYIGVSTSLTLFAIGCWALLGLRHAMREGMRVPE